MSNPYFNLIQTVWRNGKPWHRSIMGYYLACIGSFGSFFGGSSWGQAMLPLR